MAKVVVKSKVKKVKRKFRVEIRAPEYFGNQVLGNSNVSDISSFVGKTIKINLMYLTKNVKNQNVKLKFKVDEVNSGVASTKLVFYEQIQYYLNRFVKVDSTLVEDSFIYLSKDKKEVVVKPFIVTKSQATVLKASSLREVLRDLISKQVSKMTAEEFVLAISNNKFQLMFRNELKKVFPLKSFEFKKVEIRG